MKKIPLFGPHTEPTTGDTLSSGEYISWLIQGIIRRWTFLILVTIVTLCVMLTNDTLRTWWNYGASYLAIFIESVVGIAMFAQTKRDAVVIREIRRLVKLEEAKIEADDTRLTRLEEKMDALLAATLPPHATPG